MLEILEQIIEKNAWQDRVLLSGARCANRCGKGPNLVVDGKLYQGLDEGALLDLLTDKLGVSATSESTRRA